MANLYLAAEGRIAPMIVVMPTSLTTTGEWHRTRPAIVTLNVRIVGRVGAERSITRSRWKRGKIMGRGVATTTRTSCESSAYPVTKLSIRDYEAMRLAQSRFGRKKPSRECCCDLPEKR